METTSLSLLCRLSNRNDQVAWRRFVELYTPLVFQVARSKGLTTVEAEDIVQQTFLKMVEVLPRFQYDPLRSGFRSWLRKVVGNLVMDAKRKSARDKAGAASGELEFVDPIGSEVTDQDLLQSLIAQIFEIVRRDFEETTWRAFWGLVVLGKSGKEVALELGLAESTVYVAKLRVCRRLASELQALRDASN